MAKKLLAALICALLPFNAVADMTHVPPWKMVGGKACYEFQDAQKLVILDADLETYLKKDFAWAELTKNLQEAQKQMQIALTAEKNANVTLTNNGSALAAQLMDETARANKAEAKPGMFPAWAIGAGVGIAVGLIVGILFGVYVSK